MSYSSITVAYAVKRLNINYFLPAIQREFVWDSGRVISLFDSVMKGYPISSFLFWQLEYDNRDKWGVYKFIENVKRGFTHNELANLDGVREPILVIDGQQRLTSFLVGLKGTYTVKIKYKRKNDPEAWQKRRLYLNLLKDPSVEENDDLVSPSFGFQFFSSQPENSAGQYWFKVGKILDFETQAQFLSFKQNAKDELAPNLTKEQGQLFEYNLDLLYSSVWRNEVINYYLEINQEYDRALDIFVRANERGEPLSTSDLLLSIMTSKWHEVNAKDEVNSFVDYINYSLSHKNNFTRDNIMKTCLVLADLPVAYKVQNYTEKNLAVMENSWPRVKDAVERCVKCVNSWGIDENNLTAKNALVPMFYYFYLNPDLSLMTGSSYDVRNATTVRRWLIASLLNNVFGGSSDSILASIRVALKNAGTSSDFPIDQINKRISQSGRRGEFNDAAIDSFLATEYGGTKTFLALSVLYDDNNWGDKQVHQDHIFPKNMFNYQDMVTNGQEALWDKYYDLHNRVANLELLTQQENLEKLNKPFDGWIRTRDASFKKRHLIPDNPELWKFENFEQFVEEREKLIADRLDQVFGQ
jgi:hypothetical protein